MTKGNWKRYKLGDFCPLEYGKGLLSKNRQKGQIPVYGSNGINDWHNQAYVKTPGIIIGRKGTAGSVTLSKSSFWPIDTTFFIKDEPKKRNLLFTYYLLKNTNLKALVSDSAVPGLNREAAHALELFIPPLEEQKRIAGILGAFDDKIELLQKQNKTLEEMAKAIFKSWFVDFDIVKAKQKGEKKEDIIKNYHLTEELYNLFPSSFIDSSVGPIPTGWEVKTVGELLEFSIGGGWGNEEENQEFLIKAPVIRGTDIPILKHTGTCSSVPVRFHKKSNYISRQLKGGDIVLEVAGGSKGQPVGRTLFISSFILDVLPNVICASFCKLLRPNKNILLSELFYLYLEMMYQTGEIEQYQIQSTGISNFQFKQFCEDKKFVVPSMKIQKILSTKLYIDKMGNNKKQIQTLTELRDTLLPRLISGKIKV